jgi:hypothetical protein
MAFSQKKTKETKHFKQKEINVDSINVVISQHANKVDSATHTMYVQVLERTSNIQNNRDTYYSTTLAAFTLLFTVLAIYFTLNWFATNRKNKNKSMT